MTIGTLDREHPVNNPSLVIHTAPSKRSPLDALVRDVPGLLLFRDIIDPETERTILEELEEGPWLHMRDRRVRHFGYRFNYSTNYVDMPKGDDLHTSGEGTLNPLPSWCTSIIERYLSLASELSSAVVAAVAASEGFKAELEVPPLLSFPDQLTVNKYASGGGIAPHVDTHTAFEDGIVSVSLGSSTVIEFRRISSLSVVREAAGEMANTACLSDSSLDARNANTEGEEATFGSNEATIKSRSDSPPLHSSLSSTRPTTIQVHVPPRSVLIMTGASRYGYTHGIRGRRFDVVDGLTVERGTRVSLTFRKVRKRAPGQVKTCGCRWKDKCDGVEAEQH
ncbi:Alkylated DNA repair protein alkB 8 [Quaeritorhiza haematococci]|nr:Alkylated DNA repair protein alkB 8 [Quaeritorhiza haematococci]